jgi:phage protein U
MWGTIPVYRGVAKQAHVAHRPVNLTAGKRVISGIYHIQNVNAYHSRLKKWSAKFNGVATKYLTNSLGWHRFNESLTQNTSAATCLTNTIQRIGQV